MPSTKKRKTANRPRKNSKMQFLPMPRRDSDAMCLQSRLAFEAMRGRRAASSEVKTVAQAVLLTSFITEAGHGLLELSFVKEVERGILALLDHGAASGDWTVPEELLDLLPSVINEHDRQLREVRLGVVATAVERLERMIVSVLTRRTHTDV